MWWQLLRLALIFCFPIFLSRLIVLFKALFSWKKYVSYYNSRSLNEKIYLSVLLALALKLFLSAGNPGAYYFARTKTDIESPAYMIRNRFRDFINEEETKNPLFGEMYRLRRLHVQDSGDPEVISKLYTPFKRLEQDFMELELLSHELRSKDSRRNYVLYGPDALKCEVCDKSDIYRAGLVAPEILKDYVVSLIVVGLVTLSRLKYRWRKIVLFFFAVLLSYECYELLYSNSEFIELSISSSYEKLLTRPEQLSMVRHIAMSIILFLVFAIDLPTLEPPQVVSLKNINDNLEKCASKLQAARIARMAALDDDTLRKHYWEHHKKVGMEKLSIFNGAEYKKLQLELARKYNLEQILKESEDSTRTLFENVLPNSN